jgi:hypothetical protein
MDSTPLYKFHIPSSESLRQPESSEPILTKSYELRLGYIRMVQKLSFSGEGDANPYSHLRELELILDLLHIEGMSDNTLRWKFFPFSLTGKARQWYDRNVGEVKGDWGALRSKFYQYFFPVSKVVNLRKELINFTQHKEESLAASWDRFIDLKNTGPNLDITDQALLQHFCQGLNREDRSNLHAASGGNFFYLSDREATDVINRCCGYASSRTFPKKKEESPSDQREKITIASSQPIQSQDLAIHPEPSTSQNPPRIEEIPPLKDPFEPSLRDFGRTINSHPYKSPPIGYNSDSLKGKTLFELTYPSIGHWVKRKDDMSHDAIEGEQSYLEDNPIFSPSMPRQDNFFEPISKPILSPNESICAFFFETHDDPRNLPQQPKFRSHQDHQEDPQQWLENVKNLCATAIDWTDEILDIVSLRDTNPRDPLDTHNGLILEFEKEDNISENGSYFIDTSSSPSSHDQLPESPSLFISFTHGIFNPLILSPPIDFERVVVDAYIYNKYSRSRCHKS